jgi:ABC-type multidrug transport system fused ATPase/permease subunit
MQIINNLLSNFFTEEKNNIIILIATSILVNIIQANGVSHFNAKIINYMQERNFSFGLYNFKWFIFIWILFIALSHVYHIFQNKILTKLRQWVRFKVTENLMIRNNDSLSNINFTKLTTPISRIATTTFTIASNILTYVVPNISFVFMSTLFLFTYNFSVGIIFLIGNMLWLSLIWYQLSNLHNLSRTYESSSIDTENYLSEVLNNMNKIIVRGQYKDETNAFKTLMDETINKAYNFYSTSTNILFIVDIIIIITMCICIGTGIYLLKKNSLSITSFITLFTLLLLFREKVSSIAIQVTDFVELYGRTEALLPWFEEFNDSFSDESIINYDNINNNPFEKITFNNVTFKYPKTDDDILIDKSLVLNTNSNNIIGIIGNSGNGKSTIMKLVMKLYPISSGEIMIDDSNIEDMDPNFIRNNITYIDQSSSLFDKTIVENIMYGCKDEIECKKHYEFIQTFPRITELFADLNIDNDTVGYSGGNISGGQRQITNIISGLVNPSKILILDEPTNALDKDLKEEILIIIKYFKEYKQSIVIISHDRDVFPLFDEVHTI